MLVNEMAHLDLLTCYFYLEISKNLDSVMKLWSETYGSNVYVYSKVGQEEYLAEIGEENGLATSTFDLVTKEIVMIVSPDYPEAFIIHELLHPLIRAEGYDEIIMPFLPELIKEEPEFASHCKKIAGGITNQIDHIVVREKMKDYDLDPEKLNEIILKNGMTCDFRVECENIEDSLLNNLRFACNYVDFKSIDEPYQSKLLDKLSEENAIAFDYGKRYYDHFIGFDGSSEEYNKRLNFVLEEIRKIIEETIPRDSMTKNTFLLMRVE